MMLNFWEKKSTLKPKIFKLKEKKEMLHFSYSGYILKEFWIEREWVNIFVPVIYFFKDFFLCFFLSLKQKYKIAGL